MKRMRLLAFALFLLSGIMLHAQQNPRLYADDDFQGEMDLYDALEWISTNAQDGGNYTIVLETDLASSSSVLDYNGKSVIVSLKSSGADVQVTYATRSPSSSLFTVKEGVTFILEKGVALVGRPSASRPPVTVDGGSFIMNGGAVKDSKVDHDRNWFGGGVNLLQGTFTMNDGIISGNVASHGAGVHVGKDATFIMNGGMLNLNSARLTLDHAGARGGGVYVNGTFTMTNGSISNNGCYSRDGNVCGAGGGVHVSNTGKFVMQGGTISNNSGCGIYVEGKVSMNGGIVTRNTRGGVYVNGFRTLEGRVAGSFTMNNGSISENKADIGAGVFVSSDSSFIMNDGEIIGNTAKGDSYSFIGPKGGGGVCVQGTFTMNGGIISKNIANGIATGGGGVFVDGKFTMTDGIISRNSADKSGGGIFVSSGTFIKSNTAGIIYGSDVAEDKANKAKQYGHAVYTKNGSRDTTARATMALDSSKYGAEGGWE